jgi:hypothetical protein
MSELETLASRRNDDDLPAARVRVIAAFVLAVLVAVVAWTAGGRWEETSANRFATDQVTLLFAVLSAKVGSPLSASPSSLHVATLSGILINAGSESVEVQAVTWGGQGASGPYWSINPWASEVFTLPPQGFGPALTFTGQVDCSPKGAGNIRLPEIRVRVRTADGTVVERSPKILNSDAWEQAVGEQPCQT